MKTFRELCEEARNSSSKRLSINSSRPPALAQSFRSLVDKNQTPHNVSLGNHSKRNLVGISTDTQLFTNLIKGCRKQHQQAVVQTELAGTQQHSPGDPYRPSLKKRIKINRKIEITPVRVVESKHQRQQTTGILLTSSEKKEMESDINRVTQKIKQRLTSKQITQYSGLDTEKQTTKNAAEAPFEKILNKRDFICSSIKRKKEGSQETPRFQEGVEAAYTTDRFENSLIHTIEEALSRIQIEPMALTEGTGSILGSVTSQESSRFQARKSVGKFSTKSIKNRLLSTHQGYGSPTLEN